MPDTTFTILVGTTKGVFAIDGTGDRATWSIRVPFCNGWLIGHVVGDLASGRMWAWGARAPFMALAFGAAKIIGNPRR